VLVSYHADGSQIAQGLDERAQARGVNAIVIADQDVGHGVESLGAVEAQNSAAFWAYSLRIIGNSES